MALTSVNLGVFASRLTAVLLIYLGSCQASLEHRRELSDEEVLASQSFFSSQWRKKFNTGDVLYCGQAFVEDASLHITFGPMADTVSRTISLPSPALLHGQLQIEAFWNATQVALGFKEMKAYSDEGEFAASAMVVDDNTVLVSSPFSFAAKQGIVKGEILSIMWVRLGLQWKIQSMMLAIRDVSEAETSLRGYRATEAATATPEPERKDAFSSSAEPTTSTSAPAEDTDLNSTVVASGLTDEPVVKAGGHTSVMLLTMAVLIVGVAAILARRAKNRREASIAGFEAMLG